MFSAGLLSFNLNHVIVGSWATYTTVRYFVAYAVYQESTRRSAALSLAIVSSLSLILVAGLALSLMLPCSITHHHPRLRSLHKSPHHVLQFLVSLFLFAPTVVNLVLVLVWRHIGSNLSLRGRCHWNVDVVWVGVGGQCASHAPAFGVWLTAAILRLVLTVLVLVRHRLFAGPLRKSDFRTSQVVYHIASSNYRALRWTPSYRAEDVRGMDSVDISQFMQGDAPSRPSPVLFPSVHKSGGLASIAQRSLSASRMAVIPELSDSHNHNSQEHAGRDSGESSSASEDSNHRSTESGITMRRSLRHTTGSRDALSTEGSSRHAVLASNMGDEEMQGFADRFRDLVSRVSRELEESRIAEDDTDLRAQTPPLHHVLDTHTPYMSIDEFGREVPPEEPIAMLGGVIRRMPTIESVGSRELGSIRSTAVLCGMGSHSGATSPSSTRPPTGVTIASHNDTASVSLASASQPPSRSNSLHRPRVPSELGELVREALRTRGLSRPLTSSSSSHGASTSVRPGSGGSMGGSGSASGSGGESAGSAPPPPPPPPRSRRNSLGPNELLAPVTEHGELGREDVVVRPPTVPPRSPRRLCETPEQLLVGVIGTGELGELMRAERSRSWATSSSLPSATSTTYFSAGTSGSASGDSGVGSNGGLK